jgi:alanyl-tRNA synthetase
LHKVLGEHVKQAGSVVDPHRLRFDFSHHKALSLEEIRQIEDVVNEKIRENSPVKAYELNYEEAQQRQDIKQFFGEKYGSVVRVIDIDYSKELCGGTHTLAVGNIGLFRIAKEGSIAAGIRRIEAVTGAEAEQLARQQEDFVLNLSRLLKTQPAQLSERIEKLLEEGKQLNQEMKNLKQQQLASLIDQLFTHIESLGQVPTIINTLPVNADELRVGMDQVAEKLKSGVVVLATVFPDKCQLMIRISDDWVKKGLSANDMVKTIAPIIEGSGGGKQNSAQAGGKASQKLNEAFEQLRHYIRQKQVI